MQVEHPKCIWVGGPDILQRAPVAASSASLSTRKVLG